MRMPMIGGVSTPPPEPSTNMVLKVAAFFVAAAVVVVVISAAVLTGGGDKPPTGALAVRPVTPSVPTPQRSPAKSLWPVSPPFQLPALAVPTAAPPVSEPAVCRSATYTVVGTSPIGRRYLEGDTLELTIAYTTDGCTEVSGVFDGFHSPGSPQYEYFCPTSCGARLRSRFAYVPQARLSASSGTATIRAQLGSLPPVNLSAPPNIDGFTLCQVSVTFNDGKFGGSYVNQPLGAPCGGSDPTRPR